MEYVRLAPDIDTDPALEAAGWAAARVYELLLKVSGLKDLHGRIPLELQQPRWLARRWNLGPSDLPGIDVEAFIAGGVERLVEAGLLVRGDDGAVVIKGWEKFYPTPRSGASRTAAWRDRKMASDGCDDVASQPVTSVTARHGDATPQPHHSTSHHKDRPPPPPTAAEKPVVAADEFDSELWDALQDARRNRVRATVDGLGTVSAPAPPEARRPGRWRGVVAEMTAVVGDGPGGLEAILAGYWRYLHDPDFERKGWPTAVFLSREIWSTRVSPADPCSGGPS